MVMARTSLKLGVVKWPPLPSFVTAGCTYLVVQSASGACGGKGGRGGGEGGGEGGREGGGVIAVATWPTIGHIAQRRNNPAVWFPFLSSAANKNEFLIWNGDTRETFAKGVLSLDYK